MLCVCDQQWGQELFAEHLLSNRPCYGTDPAMEQTQSDGRETPDDAFGGRSARIALCLFIVASRV